MEIYEINPRRDPRWGKFLDAHPRSSVFHTAGWLEALRRTYGYEPIAFTVSRPGEALTNAVVFCQIDSWLTGARLVSLPFSDHCDVLMDDEEDFRELGTTLQEQLRQKNWRYIEIRSLHPLPGATAFFQSSESFSFHQLHLDPDLDTLFRRFHKDSTQRKIRRAERENLKVEEGRCDSLLDDFYRLQLLTRRRHHLPPQPRKWFRNLIDCLGEALRISIAYRDSAPVAAILTLCFKNTLVYKYGCSDSRFNNLGGMQLLFWKSIQRAKLGGQQLFDLGRSDLDNGGLITFKDRWGAERSTITYGRYMGGRQLETGRGWKLRLAQRIFAHAPDTFVTGVGNFLYKHMG